MPGTFARFLLAFAAFAVTATPPAHAQDSAQFYAGKTITFLVDYGSGASYDTGARLEQATYAAPHQYPSGVRTTVIVNGQIVVEDAADTGALPGRGAAPRGGWDGGLI